MLRRLLGTLISVVVGALYGGVAVGILAAISLVFDPAFNGLGPESLYIFQMIPLAVVWGGAWGALLGLLIGAPGVSTRTGIVMGTVLGVLTPTVLGDCPWWFRVLAVPFTALLGWRVAGVTRRFLKYKEKEQDR